MDDDQNETAARRASFTALAALLLALTPAAAGAHLIVDVGVSVRGPSFVPSSGTFESTIQITNLAYDDAFGVVVTDQVAPGTRVTAAASSAWSCSTTSTTVTCSAEIVAPGITTITVIAVAPSVAGSIPSSVSLVSLGSADPYFDNNFATLEIVVFDPGSCSFVSPTLTGPSDGSLLAGGRARLSWSPVPGAENYRIWTRVEGALPSPIADTTSTEITISSDIGATEWWVEARFPSCPAAPSAHRHFSSMERIHLYVSDFAGRAGVRGFTDGALAEATFATPESLGIDRRGIVYVLDSEASTVRRIGDGAVTTMVGVPGVAGFMDTTFFDTGLLNHPRAITVSAGGYAYIADTGNDMIRVLYPFGTAVVFHAALGTIAGLAGSPGLVDGVGAGAHFTSPSGIAIGSDYRLWVVDSGTNRVRKVEQLRVTSLAGVAGEPGWKDGAGSAALFRAPTGVALDGEGAILVADTGNHVIRRLGLDGIVTTVAGIAGAPGLKDGTGSLAQFDRPTGLAFDLLGNLYVADTGNHAIRRISPSGLVTTVIGTGKPGHQNGLGTSALLDAPTGLAFDPTGSLLIADSGNRVIRIATTTPPTPAHRRSVSP